MQDAPGRIVADLWPHPLTAEGREARLRAVLPGTALADLIAAEWPGAGTGVAAAVNGRPVPPELWASTRLSGGDIVTLEASVAGGDSDPLRTVLMIAVIAASIAAPYLAPAAWGATATVGGATVLTATGALLSGAVMVAGTLIVNAIAPPRLPDPPGAPGAAAADPVYSLAAGANRARPYEPHLLVLGTHRVFPDLAAAEYTEFDGDDQFLHQIFHFGLGQLEVRDLRIGDTPLDSFEEVTSQWPDINGALALFPGNVDTTPGAALDDTAWVERTTAAGTTRIGIDIAGQLFRVSGESGGIIRHAVTVAIEYWPEDDPAAKRSYRVTLANGDTRPYRRTLSYALPSPGVHTVRVRRTSAPSDSDLVHDDLAWTALRSYQTDKADYRGQTRLALKIRASGQLSGRLDRLSATASQKIPVWDGTKWTEPRASSNPAWLFRWYAKGVYIGERLAAGAGLADARIDDAAIKAWGAWCDAQELSCDYVIAGTASDAEVLTLIAQCGRASPSWGAGKLGTVWDTANRPATALVTPGNIAAGSFEAVYASAQTADEIVCRYIDPDLDWQWNSVRRAVPGVAAPSKSATLTLQGVTSREQAAMECNLQAARQAYHRRRLKWEMAAEGLAIARGDVVHISHSLIGGGSAGRCLGGQPGRVRLDREVSLSGGEDHMLFRLPDGALHATTVSHPYGAGTSGNTDTVVLAEPLPEAPGDSNPLDLL